jgi:NAD(P)-dependent dehydrogenase (short-subunit alcohol dehydrogenase family)
MGRLDGRVAVITGAGGGMGREAVLLFSEEGARVCAADVNAEAAEQTAAGARDAFAAQVDVADQQSVRAMYAATKERYGGIDILYNNAGISPPDDASILETEPDAWDRVQAVNTRGVYLCCKHGIPHLLERGGGSVINVASFVALLGAATSQISYTASKGAVLAMTRELGVQFARQGIRVNALCPGPVETPLLLSIWGDDPRDRQRRALPRERRVVLRQCGDVRGGRRYHGRIRHARVRRPISSCPRQSDRSRKSARDPCAPC